MMDIRDERFWKEHYQRIANLESPEHRENIERKVRLYKCILGHVTGIVTAIAELHLGEKVKLRD